jgi:hypothetical protein
MCELVHGLGATSKSGFSTVQASSYAQDLSNVLKLPDTAVCLLSDHMVQIHDGHCFSDHKTKPHHLDLGLTHP